MVAGSHHADGLTGLEKLVDGGGGILGGVGDHNVLVLLAREAGAKGVGVGERVVVIHRLAADGGDGLVGGGLGHGDHVEAARLVEGGDTLGVEDRPAVDERAVIERAVGNRALGLIHRDDHRTGGVGNTVIGEGLFGHVDLNVVSREPLHHVGGGLEVGLVFAVKRDDVALGVEVAVLARALVLGTEDVHLRALDVVLVAQPLADERVGVGIEVLHTALEDLDLRGEVGELFGGNIGGVAEDTVLRCLSGIIVVGRQLNGVCNGALEHGELGGVARRHIVPRVFPVGLGAVAGVAQVIALGDDIAVVAIVVGDRRDAQCLAAGDEVLGEQVVLKVRLVRGIAGLALEGLHAAMELGKREGVERADQLLHIGRLARGLEGVVAVEVIAVGGVSREIGAAVDVLLGHEDKEHVREQLILDADAVVLDGVVLLKVDLAGLAVVVSRQIAQIAGLVLDEVGDGNAALRAHRAHLGLELFFARGGEARERLVVDGLLARDHLGEIEHAVGGGDLVGVDVGVHHGHTDIIELAGLDVGEHGVRLRLGPLGEGEPLRHARLGVGDDQIGHIAPRGGLAHGELFNIQAVLRAVCHDRVELLVDLPHGVEVLVRRDLDACRADRLAAIFGRQVKVAAKVDVVAAVRVGHAVVGRCLAGSAVGGIEVVVHMEGDVEHGPAVFLVRRQLDVRELMFVLALGHPAVKISARIGVGEKLFVDVGAGIVALQRERDRSCGDRRGKRFLVHAGNGDGEGNVLALLARNERDGGVHGKLRAEERIVLGVHVLMADGECGGDRKRERQHQRQQERQGLCCIRMLRHNSSSYMFFPPHRSPAERMYIV